MRRTSIFELRTSLAALCLVACVIAAACAAGPDYQRPATDAPAAWRIDYPQAADVANTKWWEQFNDPVLDELIETALRENLDVRVAAARVDQFIATLGVVNSQAYPQLGYSGSASRNRASPCRFRCSARRRTRIASASSADSMRTRRRERRSGFR